MFVSKDFLGSPTPVLIENTMYSDARYYVFSQIDEVINQHFTVTSISYKPLSQTNRSLQTTIVPAYEILRRSDLATNMETIDNQLKELGFMALLRPHPALPAQLQ